MTWQLFKILLLTQLVSTILLGGWSCSSQTEHDQDVAYDKSEADSYKKVIDIANPTVDRVETEGQVMEKAFLFAQPLKIDIVLLLADYQLIQDRFTPTAGNTNANGVSGVAVQLIASIQAYLQDRVIDTVRQNIAINYLVITDFNQISAATNFFNSLAPALVELGINDFVFYNPLKEQTTGSEQDQDEEGGVTEDLLTMMAKTQNYLALFNQGEKLNTNVQTYKYVVSDFIKMKLRMDAEVFFWHIPTRQTKFKTILSLNEIIGENFRNYQQTMILTERYDLLVAGEIQNVYNQMTEETFLGTQFLSFSATAISKIIAVQYQLADDNELFRLDAKSWRFRCATRQVQILTKIDLSTQFIATYQLPSEKDPACTPETIPQSKPASKNVNNNDNTNN